MSIKKIVAAISLFMCFHAFSQESALETTSEEVSTSIEENSITLGKYKIDSIEFNSKGKTKESALWRNIDHVDFNKIYNSKEDAIKQLDYIKQELINTRLLDKIEYEYTETSQEELTLLKATYSFKTSHSIIVFPKPSFDSNSGIELKLKLKDTNFLGLMNPLNVDLNMNFGDDDDPEDYGKVSTGFNFQYDFPFQIKKLNCTWENDFEFNWTKDEDPEFSYKTGLTIGIPFGKNELDFNVTQGIYRNGDYCKYEDGLYFSDSATLSLPLTLGYLSGTIPFKYTPSVSVSYNWDSDGINENNADLIKTPNLVLSHSISAKNVNWVGENNFRKGWSVTATNSYDIDLRQREDTEFFAPSIELEAEYYYSWKYLGFAIQSNMFFGDSCTTKIGSKLRGALDNQHYDDEYNIDANNYALETPIAIVFNFDMPVHIITTHWLDWGYNLFGSFDEKNTFVKVIGWVPHFLCKHLDFELQANPFVDVALIDNRATGNTLSIKEGIYCGGLEMLVYPTKWKSFVIRGSLGVDLGRKIVSKFIGLDDDWRDPRKTYEIYFGLGLHF